MYVSKAFWEVNWIKLRQKNGARKRLEIEDQHRQDQALTVTACHVGFKFTERTRTDVRVGEGG